ncbi:MAG: hypothetical protein IJH48_07130 [Oscillospiraceae bacterium]|nr:hypothetical protein [Oscillospiraceae bacterium]
MYYLNSRYYSPEIGRFISGNLLSKSDGSTTDSYTYGKR